MEDPEYAPHVYCIFVCTVSTYVCTSTYIHCTGCITVHSPQLMISTYTRIQMQLVLWTECELLVGL